MFHELLTASCQLPAAPLFAPLQELLLRATRNTDQKESLQPSAVSSQLARVFHVADG
jgi:hypothetical protein